jgi:hypothetical protein
LLEIYSLDSHETVTSRIIELLLDYMWVYTYKFEEKPSLGKVQGKCHRVVLLRLVTVRLVVCGNQQRNIISQDRCPTPLANRPFRILMARAAHDRLEFNHYDLTNALFAYNYPSRG